MSSAKFLTVDTEAVDAPTRALLADWAKGGAYDALVSTDGDADRPLLADQAGQVIPGDLMGQVTAQALGAASRMSASVAPRAAACWC